MGVFINEIRVPRESCKT